MLELLDKIFFRLKNEGFSALIKTLSRKLRSHSLAIYDDIKPSVNGKCGADVGGPSDIFSYRNLLPLYCEAERVDIINYSENTAWSDRQSKFFLDNESLLNGKFFAMEAGELSETHVMKYDFLVSSHCVEHLANPISALRRWRSVLNDGGNLLIIVPCAADTFDRKRPITTLDHLVSDYEGDISEDDDTHFDEVISLHDLKLDYEAGNITDFTKRVNDNFNNRCLHHHTFDLKVLIQLVEYCDFKIMASVHEKPHLIVWAKKLDQR